MAKGRKLGRETDLLNGWSDNRTVPTSRTRHTAGGFLLSGNGTRRFGKALIAFFLGITMLVGLGTGFAPSAAAAPSAPTSSLVLPTQVQEAEKPDVWIETNIVLNTQKKPTQYVELVLKARTPTIYFADAAMTKLRYPNDGLEDDPTSGWTVPFDAENPNTYAVSRQTTFREIGASFQYNTNLLVPVSWEHEIEWDETGKIVQNAYPDFYAKYYVDESSLMKPGADGNLGTNDDVPMEGEERSAEIRRQFADDKNLQRIAVPTLQYSTESVSSAVSYAGGSSGLISMAVNSNADTVLPQESALAVVRFLYIGEEPIEHLLDKSSDPKIGYTVNSNKVSSWHNTQNGGSTKPDRTELNDFFWFADDSLIKNSTVQQALIYTSGRYQENLSVESDRIGGINQFYATKAIYNGDEVPADQLPDYTMATISYDKHPTDANKQNYTVETPEGMTSPIHRPKTDEDNITVLATARKDGDRLYSYTSNLLFTTDRGAELVDGSNENIAFTLRAGPTYKSTGGGTVDDFAAVVFIDWDDTMLGALVVPKGDARDRVEEYVEKFIHPTLRKSTAMAMDDGAAKTERLFNLSRSLDRKYTYAGSHTSDYATLSAFAGMSYSEAEAAMSTDAAYLGKTIFPDGYTVDDVDMAGSSYPLTNKLDYAFLRRPVLGSETITADTEGSPYVDADGKTVDAVEWNLGAVDYDGTQTPETVDDNYWYTSGWAVVKQPSKVSDVWTTFSTTGELSESKLPGFDSTTVAAGGHAYDGRSYFNADYIRATGDATPDANMPAGTAVAATANAAGNGEMAFATYADSAYFEFADFADVKVDELFVKACYEPCEQLSWGNNYTVVSEPYYVRYGTAASTQNGSVYAVSFEYERIDTSGNGVRRIREPWTRVQYTMDEGAGTVTVPSGENIVYEGADFYVGTKQNSTDIIAAEFTPTSAFLSLNYGVVETYGYSNFVASAARSLTANEANVIDNFNYLTDSSLPESYENGYRYNNRFGSMGYVYKATLQQLLEEACKEFRESDNWQAETGEDFKAQYFTEATLMDLNIRIDKDGATVYGVKPNGEVLDDFTLSIELADAIDAMYSALRVAYYYGGEAAVMSLDWHQLQYHVLNWISGASFGTSSGIDTGSGLRLRQDCGSFEWCRLDECAENVTVSVTNFEELFAAIDIMNDTTQLPAKRQAAEKAIKDNIVKIFNDNKIYKDNHYTDENGKEQESKSRAQLDEHNKFGSGDNDRLFSYTTIYYDDCKKFPAGDAPQYKLVEVIQKNWINWSRGPPPDPPPPFDFTFDYSDVAGSDKCTYWWYWWETKPEPVDFNSINEASATADDAVALLVHAAFELHNGNPLAWDDFKTNFDSSYNTAMRFRATERGDFFDSASENNNALIPSGSTSFTIEGDDWRTTRVLEALPDSDAFIAAVTEIVSVAATEGGASDSWNNEAVTIYNISPMGAQWEQIQYYLLHSETTEHPEYYRGMENGQYWWKGKGVDTRLIKTATPIDPASSAAARPTNATLADLTDKLAEYAGATGANKSELKEKFLIWFNEETVVDLVFKRTNRGGNISGSMTGSIAERLLGYIDSNSITPTEIRNYTWSQIQCYIINDNIPSIKGAQRYTHGEWTWEALNNVWREAKRESITDLRTLILAIDDGNMSSLDGFVDLAVEGLDFRVTAFSDSDNVENALTAMKNAYEDGGKRDFTELASDANLDSAWYLIQYYLQNKSFVTPTSDDQLLEGTATAGKAVYYWKDGWGTRTGVTDVATLRNAANSGVPARMDWLRDNGPTDWDSQGLSGPKGTSVTWPEIIEAIGRSNTSNPVRQWLPRLQFLIIHKDANRAAGNIFGEDEANKFYWWLDGQSGVNLTPSSGSPSSNAIMESIMRVMAAGDTLSGEITKDGVLGDNVAALNIRKPDANATLRSELVQYSEAELKSALQSLVTTVYEQVAAANAPSGYASWDFVTADGTFTYNAAAYDAVCNLNVYQVQHWLATGGTSYEPSDDDIKGYWWIEKEEKPTQGGATMEDLREFFIKLVCLAYETQYDSSFHDDIKQLISDELNNYGIPDAIEYPVEDIVADERYIFTSKIADRFMAASSPFHWAQLAGWISESRYMTYSAALSDYGDLASDNFNDDITIAEDDFWAYVDFLEGYGPDPFTASFSLRESVTKNRHRHELTEISDEDTALGDLPEIGEDANSPSEEEIAEKELQNGTKDEIIEQPVVPEGSVTDTSDKEPLPEDYESVPSEQGNFTKPTELINILDYINGGTKYEKAA